MALVTFSRVMQSFGVTLSHIKNTFTLTKLRSNLSIISISTVVDTFLVYIVLIIDPER